MEKKIPVPENDHKKVDTPVEQEENIEKEIDADEEVHKTSPDLIQKEDHHLPVDDEVKEG